jgi:hypothetical protein
VVVIISVVVMVIMMMIAHRVTDRRAAHAAYYGANWTAHDRSANGARDSSRHRSALIRQRRRRRSADQGRCCGGKHPSRHENLHRIDGLPILFGAVRSVCDQTAGGLKGSLTLSHMCGVLNLPLAKPAQPVLYHNFTYYTC